MGLIIMERMRRVPFLLVLAVVFLSASFSRADLTGLNARIAVPVADLRKNPEDPPTQRGHDLQEESQLLYGELVSVLEEKGDWIRVAAPQQMEFTHHQRWEGYPGWIRRAALVPEPEGWTHSAIVRTKWGQVRNQPDLQAPVVLKLSAGSRLMAMEPRQDWRQVRLLDDTTGWIRAEELLTRSDQNRLENLPELWRAQVVEAARLFLGDPYYWGGRSAHDPEAPAPPHTGPDCSGLTGLAYQMTGAVIPRDAQEQWMNARKITQEELQPGDLVFLFDPADLERVTHVLLYAGNGKTLEGPGTGGAVRESDLNERLKESPSRKTAYGSYLPRLNPKH